LERKKKTFNHSKIKQMKTLKLIFASALFLILGSTAIAQPSAAQVKKDVTKTFPGAISIEVIGNGETTEEWEGSTKMYYHRRRVKVVSKTSFDKQLPESRAIVEGLAVYTKQGGNFVYKKYNPGYEELTGMPPVDIDAINKLIKNNICKLVINCNSVVAQPISNWYMTKDSKITWYSPTSFSFKIDTLTIKRWRNPTTLDVVEGKADIRFYRDDMQSDWTRVLDASGFTRVRDLKEEKYTEEELNSMSYLNQVTE
jgi:hypothetical protein